MAQHLLICVMVWVSFDSNLSTGDNVQYSALYAIFTQPLVFTYGMSFLVSRMFCSMSRISIRHRIMDVDWAVKRGLSILSICYFVFAYQVDLNVCRSMILFVLQIARCKY